MATKTTDRETVNLKGKDVALKAGTRVHAHGVTFTTPFEGNWKAADKANGQWPDFGNPLWTKILTPENGHVIGQGYVLVIRHAGAYKAHPYIGDGFEVLKG